MDATVVITTRGRKNDLRNALRSCVQQEGVKLEVLVFDDASEDGTSEMVQIEFPQVKLFRQEKRVGYIVQRNRGFVEASSPIVFSIDDDARFTDPKTVKIALDFFHKSPAVGAIALRYMEPNRTVKQGYMPPLTSGSQVRNYIGCAHALRVDIAKKLGGYREFLVHQGEERDLCIRMLEIGYTVAYLNTPTIIHSPSPMRDHSRLAYLGLRNTFLFDILNLPLSAVVWRLPADIVLLLKHRITLRTLPERIINTLRGLGACFWFMQKRSPVSKSTYAMYSSLPAHGPVAPENCPQVKAIDAP